MNKVLTIIITIILTAAISSTATYVVMTKVLPEDKETTVAVNNGNGATQNNQNTSSEQNQLVGGEQTKTSVDSCDVDIKSARLSEDKNGDPIVIITYAYKNNTISDDFTRLGYVFSYKSYQNGVELPESRDVPDNESTYHSLRGLLFSDIKPGASTEIQVAYKLNDTTTDVVVELIGKDNYGAKGFFVSRTFNFN